MKDQAKSFSFKKSLILVIILALPGFCYYLLQEKGKNRYKPLPFYGEKHLAGTFHSRRGKQIPDTVYHAVRPFSMKDINGQSITFEPDSGVAVLSLFYTGNEMLAHPIQVAMQKIAKRFQKNEMVHLYSLTVDPERDTPQQMQAYRAEWGNYSRWKFLIADNRKQITHIARTELLLDVVYNEHGTPPITHSSAIVLLDSKRRIRGYYDALLKEDVDRLVDEFTLLLTEEFRNISVSRE